MNRIQNARALAPKHSSVSEKKKKKSAGQWPIHVKYTVPAQ